ncbi:MAG: two-component sensor histidine kinase [Planctomycetes bacterium]|nr:two-component sensor histidine kinase [Planctomycetota bacterium]
MERTNSGEHDNAPPSPAPSSTGLEGVLAPRSQDQRELLVRLAAGLAHEIKNPLSTMSINLALMEEDLGKNRSSDAPELSPREKRVEKRVRALQREIQRLETIVEDFLRYARGGQINRAPSDLGALVREALEFVEPEDARQGIRHHVDLPMGLPLVMLDEGAFRQALLNLFVNSRHAMPSGGELIVRVRREGNFAELSVTDTGVGMKAEEVEHCFDPYFSTKKSGTGLGLSTTRRIVEEHGGTITVVSEVGRGTNFSIVLPLVVEIHSAAGARAEGAPADGGEDA